MLLRLRFWLFAVLTWVCVASKPVKPSPGSCPALVTRPQPRTEPYNIKFAEKLAEEVREADAGQGLELIFYGDSITEQWRGTDQGRTCVRCDGDADIFQEYFGRYSSDVLAVGGDQVGHLLWRLLHGDIPILHEPKVVVVMIGTNDLGAVSWCTQGNASALLHASKGIITRLTSTVELLRGGMPQAKVLMLGVLPRGDKIQPGPVFQWPGAFTDAIHRINIFLEDFSYIDQHVHYLDCGPDLLVQGEIVEEMFGDGLHPTAKGMRALANCLAPEVYRLMGDLPQVPRSHLSKLIGFWN